MHLLVEPEKLSWLISLAKRCRTLTAAEWNLSLDKRPSSGACWRCSWISVKLHVEGEEWGIWCEVRYFYWFLKIITDFRSLMWSRDQFQDAAFSGNSTFTHMASLSQPLHILEYWNPSLYNFLCISLNFVVFLRLGIMFQVTSCHGSLHRQMSACHYQKSKGPTSSVFLRILHQWNSSEICSAGEKDFPQPLSGFSVFQKDIRELLLLRS